MSSKVINIILVIALLAGGCYFGTQPLFAASSNVRLNNAGFESGDLSGWNKTLSSRGASAVATTNYVFSENVSAKAGNYFAVLFPDQSGVNTKLSQTFSASQGEVVSGWANFCSQDYFPFNDYAEVVIKDNNGTELSSLFSANSGQLGPSSMTDWTYWQYTFTAPGINTYTIEGRVENVLDNKNSSVLCLDGANTNSPLSRLVKSNTKQNQNSQLSSFSSGTASFSPVFDPEATCALSLPVIGEGTISILSSPDQTLFLPDSLVTVQATPADGFVFNGWSGDIDGDVSTDNPMTFTINSNATITANFNTVSTFTLNVTTDGNGSIIIDPQQDFYNFGTEITITPSPVIGNHFTGWTGPSYEGNTSPLVFKIKADTDITAHFAEDFYSLDITITGSGQVDLSPLPSETGTYQYGTVVTLTPLPEASAKFINWESDFTGADTSPALTIVMDTSKSLTAFFDLIQVSVAAGTADNNGTISPIENTDIEGVTVVGYGNDQSFLITPNQGYRIGDVTLDGSSDLSNITFSADESGTYTLYNVTAGHTILVSFINN